MPENQTSTQMDMVGHQIPGQEGQSDYLIYSAMSGKQVNGY